MSDITMYSKGYCPFCSAASALLSARGVDFEVVDITGNGRLREEMIARSNGASTVPQIFIGDHHVGGFDNLNALHKSGELDRLLQ